MLFSPLAIVDESTLLMMGVPTSSLATSKSVMRRGRRIRRGCRRTAKGCKSIPHLTLRAPEPREFVSYDAVLLLGLRLYQRAAR